MRYGGYVLFAIPFFVLTSISLEKLSYNKQKLYINSIIFIILTVLIFNSRNLIRINKEIKVYNYNILKSPFYFTDKVEPELVHKRDNFYLYSTKIKNVLGIKNPCSYDRNLKSKNFCG